MCRFPFRTEPPSLPAGDWQQGDRAVDVVINLIIFVHFVAFVAGGSNSVVGPVIGTRMASASPEQRAGYIGVMTALGQVGKVAMATLLITGPLIMFMKYGGLGGASIWFWIKMALVAIGVVSTAVFGRSLQATTLAAPAGFSVAAKTGAVALIVLWLAIIFLGRAIAYDVEVWGSLAPRA